MGVTTLFMGVAFFTTLYIFTKKALDLFFQENLSTADQYFIAEKCVNSVQAVTATVIGVIILQACQENIMYDMHWLTNTYAWFGLPYFFYDVWAMYNTHYYLNEDLMMKMTVRNKVVHYIMANKAMLVHHLILPIVFFPIILYFRDNKGDYFVGVLYTCEAAIPFICLRFILSQLKKKDNILYIISGLLMILVFFVVRVCIFPFLYWKYSTYSGIPFIEGPFKIPTKCNIGCLAILLIQVYFLYLMIRGAARAFLKMYQRRKLK